MNFFLRLLLPWAALAWLLTCCSTTRDAGAPPEEAGTPDTGAASRDAAQDRSAEADAPRGPCSGTSDGGRSGPPGGHRAAATTCGPSALSAFADAGSCSSDTECQRATGAYWAHCTHGLCTTDQCYSDSDCATGTACLCGVGFVPYSYVGANACVASNCRIDADCGVGQYCAPSSTGDCGFVAGLYCTTAEDTCVDPATDCPCPPPPPSVDYGSSICQYAQTVGHWVCGVGACNG